jgi:mannosylglycoprotein endo-beta-mannosidase
MHHCNLGKMKKLFILSVLSFCLTVSYAQVTPLVSGWKVKKASEVTVDGCHLTMSEPDQSGWISATVPGTILTTLVNNNLISDPYYGMNNEKIPDVYNEGRDLYTYWYYTRFSTESIDSTKQVWLCFRGINYFAEVYLNGRRISGDIHEGMFLREKYNITPYLNSKGPNRLAVLVEPPAHPGNPNGGQGGDGMIGRDATMQFTAGWDWVQPVRDRNTGIWDQVTIEITGDVDMRNGFARTRVPGARLPGELQDPAFVTFSADMINATGENVEGEAALSYLGAVEKRKVKLGPYETTTVTFTEIRQTDPRIWWPNGMGQPSLYPAVITFQDRDGKTSDREDIMFGFRETGSYFDEKTGSRVFTINGQKIFIRGANWIASDAMLRLNPDRYDAEVRMHAEMNMNMIRVWGGSIMERPEFYDACDKYGILVWQDLWITGDCNGRWPQKEKAETQERRREYPDRHSLFIESMADQLKMLRNHPSLYLICGGNEFPPPPELELKVRQTLDELKGGWVYLNESTSPDLLRNTKDGTADGPYNVREPLWFFTERWFPFDPEIGSVGMPNIEGLKKMMDEKDLVPPSGKEVNEVWKYHKYLGYGDMITKMGEPSGLNDFITKAQIVNYEQYRSMIEGYTSHMWDWYTGLLIWKSQNPWPALKGQFYDWFLDQNAGYYGYKHAAAPVHLQFNPSDSTVYIVNATPKERKGMRLEATLADENGKEIWKQSQDAGIPANSVIKAWKVNLRATPALVHFLKLRITYVSTGLTIDECTYWLPYNDDRTALMKLREAKVVGQMMKSSNEKFTVDLANSGDVAAFFIRMKVVRALDGEMVTPAFIDDNYITLVPGEKKSIIVDVSSLSQENRNTPLLLSLEGVNLKGMTIRL